MEKTVINNTGFSIGDRVKVTYTTPWDRRYYHKGSSGVVVCIPNAGILLVRFDKGYYDKSCDSSWYVEPKQVIKIGETE